jgi:hypothetical protein
LVAVDDLQEGAMQERILHIELMNWPGVGDDQGEHGVNRGRLNHWTEGLIIVDAKSLGEVVKNRMSLVPVQGTVGIELVLEIPLVGDDIGANRARDKILGVVGDQGSKLVFHGAPLVWIGKGSIDRGGYQQQG